MVLALIAAAGRLSVEKRGARARELRAEVDELGVAEREAHLRDRRFLRFSPTRDALTRMSCLLDPEATAAAGALLRDERTTEQIALDSAVGPVLFDGIGTLIDIGRDQRLCTERQRIGLAGSR